MCFDFNDDFAGDDKVWLVFEYDIAIFIENRKTRLIRKIEFSCKARPQCVMINGFAVTRPEIITHLYGQPDDLIGQISMRGTGCQAGFPHSGRLLRH